MTSAPSALAEAIEEFECFGGSCAVLVRGSGPAGSAPEAASRAKRQLLAWHRQFSRFDPASELSALNRDPRETVAVSPMMERFIEAARGAASITGGLFDPTLVDPLEAAGYADDFDSGGVPVDDALRLVRGRAPAAPSRDARWRKLSVDRRTATVTRPTGVRLDTGGIAKGMFGDVLAAVLGGHESFAVDAAGDVRLGGAARMVRPVQVASPFDGSIVHAFELIRGAAATSGIGRRSWLRPDGTPAHHLLDPATGRPAFTGVVQATALAPLAVEAEALAKAAVLTGPGRATDWLRYGGLVVYDDRRFDLRAPAPELILR